MLVTDIGLSPFRRKKDEWNLLASVTQIEFPDMPWSIFELIDPSFLSETSKKVNRWRHGLYVINTAVCASLFDRHQWPEIDVMTTDRRCRRFRLFPNQPKQHYVCTFVFRFIGLMGLVALRRLSHPSPFSWWLHLLQLVADFLYPPHIGSIA